MYHAIVDLLEPLTLLFAVLFFCQWRLWRAGAAPAWAVRTMLAATVLLAAFCTPAVSYLSVALLERQYPRLQERPEGVDAIVILGGGVLWPASDDGRTRPTESTLRRCYRAVQLYQQGPPCPLIVCGGIARSERPGETEAAVLSECLRTMAVPESDIVLEGRSRNTYENVREAAGILQERDWNTVLVVTDATHLPRTMACFHKLGLEPIAAGADYRSHSFRWTPMSLLPRAGAAKETQGAVHEFLGSIWYRWKGRI